MFLFATTIVGSAFLLFLVQPIIARQILPWFGGSAGVWATCLVFFQCVLLAGYAYADLLVRHARPLWQYRIHAGVVLASLAFLPIMPGEALKPTDPTQPAGRILWLLVVTIGLPYFVLATTGPLVQAWFSRRFATARVYRLYALSNLASLVALVGYPFLIEPQSTLRLQVLGWSVGYALLAALLLWAARTAGRQPALVAAAVSDVPDLSARPGPAGATGPTGPNAAPGTSEPPGLRLQATWILLSAIGSALLLSVTTHLTQNVAPIPFLWVMPLAIYLLTFILCFESDGWYRRPVFLPAAAIAIVLMTAALEYRLDANETFGFERGILVIRQAVPLYLGGLFVLCMTCHGELVRRKPAPRYLTRFYLMLSLGGAIGGLLVGLAAPALLSAYWELPIALAVLAATLALLPRRAWRLPGLAALAATLYLGQVHVAALHDGTLLLVRNFYGSLRVKWVETDPPEESDRRLIHGTIIHGAQFVEAPRDAEPTMYYGRSSGIGQAIAGQRAIAGDGPQRIGLIGLGIGTLAAYGRAGDLLRFYELNPLVLDVARSHFTYLSQSAATIETALGDARLVLEREPAQRFDLLVVDAFSSDAIPVHLLTHEALQIYRRHLKPDGAVAFHLTNRYLSLAPAVAELAHASGLQAVQILEEATDERLATSSDWVLVTGSERFVAQLATQDVGEVPERRPGLRLWTDDYINLFGVLD